MENAAGQRYEELLAARVCGPLGLVDTSCGPGREAATGYRRGRRVPSFRMPTLPGAAALRSTADDMLRYLQAHLALEAVPLPDRTDAAALRTALGEVRRPRVGRRRTGARICLGWNRRPLSERPGDETPAYGAAFAETAAEVAAEAYGDADADDDELVYHAGATRGFTAFVGFSPRAQVGLAVLAGAPPLRGRGLLQDAYATLRTLVAERRPTAERGPVTGRSPVVGRNTAGARSPVAGIGRVDGGESGDGGGSAERRGPVAEWKPTG
ncbi:serine hydrolase [Kitasatospora sp. NBC_00315]|uniref:serine hydrolase n=1 Tax=Kitasatospora sp. NBC_00315 TaxID=2975963 RepID=UPI00352E5546